MSLFDVVLVEFLSFVYLGGISSINIALFYTSCTFTVAYIFCDVSYAGQNKNM